MELDHVGIAVESIEDSRKFYETGLGLEAAPEVEEVASQQVRVLKLKCADPTHIELIEPTSPDAAIAKLIPNRGPGLHHLCYRTTEIQADGARLKEQGVSAP